MPARHLRFETDFPKEHSHAFRTFPGRKVAEVDFQGLADDRPDGHAGVQRAERILKDVLDPAAEGAKFLFGKRKNVPALPEGLARGGGDEFHERPADGRLAAAALAHQPDDPTGVHGEADAVHGPEGIRLPAQQPRAYREMHL